MALPMNATPIYTLTIPSSGKEFKYRPFLVKDEKALLIAQESSDPVVMLDTVKEVILSCAKSPIDIDRLASFDSEYIFTQLRAVSVGELVDLYFRCDVCTDEKAIAKVTVDLTKLKVETPEGHTNKIALFDDVGVVLKYPTIQTLKMIEENDGTNMTKIFDTVVDCIDYIYDAEEVFAAKEQSRTELIDFLNNLTSAQFALIQNFFVTMPSLKTYIEYDCPVCSRHHNKYMEGLASFF